MTIPSDYKNLKAHPVYELVADPWKRPDARDYYPIEYLASQLNGTNISGYTAPAPRMKLYKSFVDCRKKHASEVKTEYEKAYKRYQMQKRQGKQSRYDSLEDVELRILRSCLPRRMDMSIYKAYQSMGGGVCYGASLRWLELRKLGQEFPTKPHNVTNLPTGHPGFDYCPAFDAVVVDYQEEQTLRAAQRVTFRRQDRPGLPSLASVTPAAIPSLIAKADMGLLMSPLHAMAFTVEASYCRFFDPNHGLFKFDVEHLDRLLLHNFFAALWRSNDLANNVEAVPLTAAINK